MTLPRAFQALRYRNYRLFWLAQITSLLGLALQSIAEGWLVYRLTNSPRMLGLIGFLPAMLAAPVTVLGGVLADRFDRRRFMLMLHSLLVVPPTLLAWLIASDQVQVWHVFAITIATDILSALVIPVRGAFIPQLVPKEDLLNAQALGSMVYQASRILGPALGGWVIGSAGEAMCFLANGLSYLAVVVAMLAVRLPSDSPKRALVAHRRGLRDIAKHIVSDRRLLGLLALFVLVGFFLSPYNILLPVYAVDILNVGAPGLGWLNAAGGAGALLGGLAVAYAGHAHRRLLLGLCLLAMPVTLAAFGWSHSLPLSLGLLVMLGLFKMTLTTVMTNLILLSSPAEQHGRLSSFTALAYIGAPTVGGQVVTEIAERAKAPFALTTLAVGFALGAWLIGVRFPELRAKDADFTPPASVE